ncbi:putative endo-beta-1,6-glucanase [Talaromyces proteolyticus]|uniref:glucan endo-1,6-beta-glucosidase n=1 Tax=Talaromyces proteolyticus TaxID=1131652 RepID=A0AAD4PVS7_9EURO|nr:putative endo-beta-1,6-glucanase [Talaromyces proteolyticus]KAH8691658.1 putative endo-beta-1,6-glucanase [Talaromyces proteolyticus]
MRSLAVIATLCGLSAAWMPGVDRNIYSKEGANLFKRISPITKRTLPTSGKIRGVNLGSLFVFEPWIAENTWSNMGCGNQASEFDCVMNVGQAAANTSFSNHWDSWIVEEDFINMTTYGLNTVRIPVGYWLREDIVYTDSEHFSQGGLSYLEQVCGWASDHGLYIIIDLHGAPGAQVAQNADTGQYASSPGFYVDYQFERALEFLEWMTTNIHTNNNFRNVGMLEIANEPVQDPNSVGELTSSYYPNAFTRIRAAEAALNISQGNELHIEMMNEKWGSGDPTQYLTDNWYAAYDDHRYLKWDTSVPVTPDDYLNTSCNDDRGGNWPTIVGEWSLSPPDDVQWNSDWDPSTNQAFYQKWFAAQVMTYEKQEGWVFWSWKSELGDYRWSYQDAVAAGVIPTDLDSLYNLGVC